MDNGTADRNEIANAKKTKGNQKAEGRFGPVSRRAKRIETKDRDSLRGTDLLGPFVTGFDGFADQEIKYVHEEWFPMNCSRQKTSPPLSVPTNERIA